MFGNLIVMILVGSSLTCHLLPLVLAVTSEALPQVKQQGWYGPTHEACALASKKIQLEMHFYFELKRQR